MTNISPNILIPKSSNAWPLCSAHSQMAERGFSTSTSYEYKLWVRVTENKVQLTRIRDENGKFRSILPDCPNLIPYSTF